MKILITFLALSVLFNACNTDPIKGEDDRLEPKDLKAEKLENLRTDYESNCYVNSVGEMFWMPKNDDNSGLFMSTTGDTLIFSDIKGKALAKHKITVLKKLLKTGEQLEITLNNENKGVFKKSRIFLGSLNPKSGWEQYLAIKDDNTFHLGGQGKTTMTGNVIEIDSTLTLKIVIPFKQDLFMRKRGNSLLQMADGGKIVLTPVIEFKQIIKP
jgi:hypothetical protein